MHCFVCHSETSPEDLLPLPGKKGGGRTFPEGAFRFTVRSPNITPDPETGAGKWADDVFVRALRDGIGHDGRVLFSLMPYEHFRRLTDEDLASAIGHIWHGRDDRYSQLRSTMAPDTSAGKRRVEMSYIGG